MAVRSGRGAGSFGGADELSQASRGNAARREKIAQLLGLNLCKSAHVAAAALDKAGGNVDVAAAHLIEGSAPMTHEAEKEKAKQLKSKRGQIKRSVAAALEARASKASGLNRDLRSQIVEAEAEQRVSFIYLFHSIV